VAYAPAFLSFGIEDKEMNAPRTKSEKAKSGLFVHPQALVESEEIGSGTRVWAFAHVMKGAKIGNNCNICDHAFIESNANLGDNVTVKNGISIWDGVVVESDVFLGPNMVFTNDPNPRSEIKKGREQLQGTVVKKGATIGANATVLCGLTVGAYSFIAAGAVVTRNVPDHALVIGVPARHRGWMCCCASKIKLISGKARCSRCGRQYKNSKAGLREG
jgi:UDP-2-acetamido-3-amino-2,3-dideoxy-glucuronate N-acetyltransferase